MILYACKLYYLFSFKEISYIILKNIFSEYKIKNFITVF